jgi:hypothetical protein
MEGSIVAVDKPLTMPCMWQNSHPTYCEILDGFCEVLLCDARVCVGGVAHGLCLVLNTALVGALARQIVICWGVCL